MGNIWTWMDNCIRVRKWISSWLRNLRSRDSLRDLRRVSTLKWRRMRVRRHTMGGWRIYRTCRLRWGRNSILSRICNGRSIYCLRISNSGCRPIWIMGIITHCSSLPKCTTEAISVWESIWMARRHISWWGRTWNEYNCIVQHSRPIYITIWRISLRNQLPILLHLHRNNQDRRMRNWIHQSWYWVRRLNVNRITMIGHGIMINLIILLWSVPGRTNLMREHRCISVMVDYPIGWC